MTNIRTGMVDQDGHHRIDLDADIVGGPVLPVFDDPHHGWPTAGFMPPSASPAGRVDMIYGAGSMLAKRRPDRALPGRSLLPRFRLFTGGSDLAFFERCRLMDARSPGRIRRSCSKRTAAFANHPGWQLRRNFRKGSERARIDRDSSTSMGGRRCAGAEAWRSLPWERSRCPWPPCAAAVAVVAGLNRIARGTDAIAAEFNLFMTSTDRLKTRYARDAP